MLQFDSDSPIECIKHRMMIKGVSDTAHIFSSSFSLQVIIEHTLSISYSRNSSLINSAL